MSSPDLILDALRARLRAAGITYKLLAERIGVSESSVKRMFGQKDMALSRLAEICQATGIPLEELLRGALDTRPRLDALSLPQERSLVANPRLLLMAICCLGHWNVEQVVDTYKLSEAECITLLAELDRLGLIELKPLNRYQLRVSNAFRWLPDGPVQHFFREHVVEDYFAGRFAGAAVACQRKRVVAQDRATGGGTGAAAPERPAPAGRRARGLYLVAGVQVVGTGGVYRTATLMGSVR